MSVRDPLMCRDCGAIESEHQREYSLDCQCGGPWASKPQPDPSDRVKADPTLEQWLQSMYEGADLDKMEIPARVVIRIAESYANRKLALRADRIQKAAEEFADIYGPVGLLATVDFKRKFVEIITRCMEGK